MAPFHDSSGCILPYSPSGDSYTMYLKFTKSVKASNKSITYPLKPLGAEEFLNTNGGC